VRKLEKKNFSEVFHRERVIIFRETRKIKRNKNIGLELYLLFL